MIDELRTPALGPDSFMELMRVHQLRVYRLARGYCHNATDAEDLSQEVWLKVYRSMHSFRGESSFLTWVRQILVNTFLNWKRSQRVTVPLDADLEVSASSESYDDRILMQAVRNALLDFPSRQRLIVLLKYEEDMTHEEIAALLSCSPGTVKKTLFRSMERLRAFFQASRLEDHHHVR